MTDAALKYDGSAEARAGARGLAAIFEPRWELRASILAGALLLIGFVLADLVGITWAIALVWTSLAIGMVYGVKAAFEALLEKSVDIDVLMVVGAGLAALVGHPEEGALLLFLFTLSGSLEALAMQRTRREIEALHKLMPREAHVFREGDWIEVDPHELEAGERIKIRPGDIVPADAVVIEGTSALDQSTLTGESMPREVHPGDDLFAGAVNQSSALEATVTRPAAESSLQRVLDLVIEARQQREPVQRLIDRLSQPYAISVMVVSVVVVLAWWLIFADPIVDAAYTAITFLIVMSPCALIISTPTVTLSAIGRGARAGVLFKGGQSMEALSRVGAICFDKTGTLTVGKPRVTQVHPVAWSSGPELLAVAAGLEADSTHPIAAAVRDAAERKGVDPLDVAEVEIVPGRGLTGSLEGVEVRLGNVAHTEEMIPTCLRARVRDVLDRIQKRGQIGVVVARADAGDGGQAAVIIISDPIRPSAAELIRRLHALDVRPLHMLTGDNANTAAFVAEKVGVDQWEAELFPEDKVKRVRDMRCRDDHHTRGVALRSNHCRGVAFIGDGVNDAPALSAADVGIAIGSIGSDAALESADIVLLSDDLLTAPWAINLARRARSILRFNIFFALSVIIGMGAATLVGSRIGFAVPLSVGVLAHEGGTLLVVANSLRLLWTRGVQPGPGAEPQQRVHESRPLDENALNEADTLAAA